MDQRQRICEALKQQHRLAELKLGLARRQWPEWLMVIDLYRAREQGMREGFKALAATSGLSTATAFRRTVEMIDAGMLDRKADPDDRRRSLVSLSDRTRCRMDHIMDELGDILKN